MNNVNAKSRSEKACTPSYNHGFTLIELAVVLVIIGILVTSVLATASTRIDAANLSASKAKTNFIVESIKQFVKQYGHLPCPADPTFPSTNSNYGIGVKTTDGMSCDTTTMTGVTSVMTGSTTTGYVGILPHNTLGLAKQFEEDGWGRSFTYAVTYEAVNDTTFADATENISLLSPATPTDLASAVYSAGFALACHGKNGYGAYVNGTQFSPTAGSDIEDQNASLSLNFVQVFPHLASDDIVRSRAIWQLKD
jgi:prepilin-type N-terminal cleavage/methylation domain-containing protein